jgi:hypothetical protein
MQTLRQFIRETTGWLRRPIGGHEQAAVGHHPWADDISSAVTVAFDVAGMDDALRKHGLDAYDVVDDPTEFDQAVERDDVEAARDELLAGLSRWTGKQHRPMRAPTSGQPSLKRSMGY